MSPHGTGVRISSDCTYPRRDPSAAMITELSPLSAALSSDRAGAVAATAITYPTADMTTIASTVTSTPRESATTRLPLPRPRLRRAFRCL